MLLATELVSDGMGIQTQFCLAPQPMHSVTFRHHAASALTAISSADNAFTLTMPQLGGVEEIKVNTS